jgi:hypothetical protein
MHKNGCLKTGDVCACLQDDLVLQASKPLNGQFLADRRGFVGILKVLATRNRSAHIARWMEALAFIRF